MDLELEHQAYAVFLALWAGYLLQTFNIFFATIVVIYVGILIFFLRRGFHSQRPLQERIGLHGYTILVTLLIIPGILYFVNYFFGSSLKVSTDQVALIGVIISAWIISVEIARHDEEIAENEWRAT